MNRPLRKALAGAAVIALSTASGVTNASDWLFRVGGHFIDPKSNNSSIVNVGSGESLTFDVTYHYTPHWGFELLAAAPFTHDIDLKSNGSKVASVRQLPPTFSVQYNFLPESRLRPYVGAGLNATLFFKEQTRGALAGSDLSLKNSVGPAVQLGVDYDLTQTAFVSLDARWIDIDTRARLDGVSLGDVNIDPMTVGLSFGWRFGR
jgi:outer membrane protein